MSEENRACDLAIVGAGAAGLFAALFAGRAAGDRSQIIALDGAAKVGAKILVAGGGRCNVTHDVVRVEDYTGGGRGDIAECDQEGIEIVPGGADGVSVRGARGVALKREETGKLFPTTDRARTVLDGILAAVTAAGVEVRTGCRVKGIERMGDHFHIFTSRGDIQARRVVLATGGMALPKTGSDGFGYSLARGLGHSVTRTHPALVPLILSDRHWLTGLSGVSFPAELVLTSPTGKTLHIQQGSLLLTHFGLSGPAAMDISRHWLAAQPPLGEGGELRLSLLPGSRFEEVESAMLHAVTVTPRARLADVLQRLAPDPPARLRDALLQQELTLDPATPIAQLPRDGPPLARSRIDGATPAGDRRPRLYLRRVHRGRGAAGRGRYQDHALPPLRRFIPLRRAARCRRADRRVQLPMGLGDGAARGAGGGGGRGGRRAVRSGCACWLH